MHLINAKTYKLEYFVGAIIPRYAILSHVWGTDEVLFHDLSNLELAQSKKGFIKIELTCKQALRDGLHYAWVDTCCINKESSAELSEAINSMYRWYLRAARCYAYLSDLKSSDDSAMSSDGEDSTMSSDEGRHHTDPSLSESRWFTRGWTLQELIAPSEVHFYDHEWRCIGTKKQALLKHINEITGVDTDVLKDSNLLRTCTIAKRMSWAATRATTRKEDEAYCLLGIFDVNMPLLYGEEEGAFERLQHEIIKKTTDQSIFLHDRSDGSLLARSPQAFAAFGDIMPCEGAFADDPFELTNAGLRIKLPITRTSEGRRFQGVLNCHNNHDRLAIRLEMLPHRKSRDSDPNIFAVAHGVAIETTNTARALLADPRDSLIVKDPWYAWSQDVDSEQSCKLWLQVVNWAEQLQPAVLRLEDLWPPRCWDRVRPNTLRFETNEGTRVARVVKFSSSSAPCSGGILLSIRPHSEYVAAFFRLFEVDTDQEDWARVNLEFFQLERSIWYSLLWGPNFDRYRWGNTIPLQSSDTYVPFNVGKWTIGARIQVGIVNDEFHYTFKLELK